MKHTVPVLFPHISRLISARLLLPVLFRWSILLLFLVYNLVSLRISGQKTQTTQKKVTSEYINQLWQTGQRLDALSLLISHQKNGKSSVLGVTSDPISYLSHLETGTKNINEKQTYWEAIMKEKPDYRDSFIMGAILAWEAKDENAARTFLLKARELDANDPYLDTVELFFANNPIR